MALVLGREQWEAGGGDTLAGQSGSVGAPCTTHLEAAAAVEEEGRSALNPQTRRLGQGSSPPPACDQNHLELWEETGAGGGASLGVGPGVWV